MISRYRLMIINHSDKVFNIFVRIFVAHLSNNLMFMNYKILLATLLITLFGIRHADAQTIRQGSQITAEGNMISGKPYLLYYVGNNGCYVKAVTVSEKEVFKALAGDRAVTDEAIYYFIQDESSNLYPAASWSSSSL